MDKQIIEEQYYQAEDDIEECPYCSQSYYEYDTGYAEYSCGFCDYSYDNKLQCVPEYCPLNFKYKIEFD